MKHPDEILLSSIPIETIKINVRIDEDTTALTRRQMVRKSRPKILSAHYYSRKVHVI